MRISEVLLTAWLVMCGTCAANGQLIQAADRSSLDAVCHSVERQVAALLDALLSSEAAERRQAVRTLGVLQNQLNEAAWPMVGLLSDRRSAVRVAAIDALLQFKDIALLERFLAALADHDPRVQCRAVIGIHQLLPLYGLPGLKGDRKEPAIVREWYAEKVETIKQRPVRGLLALACMQSADDIPLAIPLVAKCLGEDDPQLCQRMWSILQGRSLAPELGRCLSHHDARIRRGAARMLYELESMGSSARETLVVAESLTQGLTDSDSAVRLYCLLTLIKHRQADPAPLVRRLADADPTVRCAAVEALRQRRPRNVVSLLCHVAAHDKNVRVRVRAAFALGCLAASSPKMRERIDRRITDQYAPRTRALVDMALTTYWYDEDGAQAPPVKDTSLVIDNLFRAIRAERAAPLPDPDGHDAADGFDATIIGALGTCGPAARPALPLLLQDLKQLTSLGSGDVRTSSENRRLANSLYALAQMGPAPELIGALEDDHPVVRVMAAMALSDQRQYAAKAVPILIDSLVRDCWGQCVFSHTRGANVDCLAMCGPDAVPALLDLIRNDRHAFAAQDALSIMDTEIEQVIALLLPVLSDDRESPRVRVAVAEALRTLGKNDARVFQCWATVLSDVNEVESVRVAAAKGLRDSSAGDWTAIFESVAHDPSLEVRAAVRMRSPSTRADE